MLLEFTEGLVAWEIAILAVISLAVGVLGGMVGLALGTMRLPAMLLIGMEAGVAGGHQHLGQHTQRNGGRVPSPAGRAGGLAHRPVSWGCLPSWGPSSEDSLLRLSLLESWCWGLASSLLGRVLSSS